MKRRIWAAALALLLWLPQSALAARVVVEEQALAAEEALLTGNTTYVSVRAFCELTGMDVTWEEGAAVARSEELTLRAEPGQPYIQANGRYFYTGSATPVRIFEGMTMAPVRTLARAFQGEVHWEQADGTAHVMLGEAAEPGESRYDPDEVYWLSRIISAESQGEPLTGKIAVGNVVLNRVEESQFPNTIYGVIFDRENGVQFTPVSLGSIYWEPTEESVVAAKLCLDGAVTVEGCLYFQNAALAQSSWVAENRPYLTTIGNHQFYG